MPSAPISAHQCFQTTLKIVGDEKRRFLPTVVPYDQLSNIRMVSIQSNDRFVYQRIGILPLDLVDMNDSVDLTPS